MPRFSLVFIAAISVGATGGCQPTKPATAGQTTPLIHKAGPSAAANKEPVAAITNTAPCASQLHDISEPLLLYYLKNHHLPGRLEELRTIPGFESIELTCPVSKRPYLYNPVGITSA